MKTRGFAQNSWNIVLLIIGYFILQVIIRLCLSPGGSLDESEELILTQELRWGYGSQPPLYTWLQWVIFSIFGMNIFGLLLLKNGLLCGTFLLTYFLAKDALGGRVPAAVAVAGLFFIPQIAWESQRDLTHSVLGTAIAVGILLVLLRLYRTGKTSYYALFGLLAGLGVLSKYNFIIFLIALIVAVMSLSEVRAILSTKKIWIALIVFLMVTSPHFYWIITHIEAAFSQQTKLTIQGESNNLVIYAKGLWSLTIAIISFLGLPMALCFLLFGRGMFLELVTPETTHEKVIYRTVCVGLVLCVLLIFCFQAQFKDRWMQPLFITIPIYLASRCSERFGTRKINQTLVGGGVVAVAVMIALTLRTLAISVTDRPSRLNVPFEAMVQELRESPVTPGIILAENRFIGGNLRMGFQDSTIVVPELALFQHPPGETALVIWDASESAAIPSELSEFAMKLRFPDLSKIKPEYLEAPYRYSNRKTMRFGYIMLPPQTMAAGGRPFGVLKAGAY